MRDLSNTRCPVLSILRKAANIPLRLEPPEQPERGDSGPDLRKDLQNRLHMPGDTLGQTMVKCYYRP